MIDVDYNEYKETIAQNMNLIIENHDLKEEVERLKEVLDNIHEEIKYLYRKVKRMWYDDIQTLKKINEIVEKELKGDNKE